VKAELFRAGLQGGLPQRLSQASNNDALEPKSRVMHREPLPLGARRERALGPNPTVALVLAIVIGLIVFTIIWRIRRTFGMKD
jgi:hypothetical protein